jgi:alcohol dehydrogenase
VTFDICQQILKPGGRLANVGVHGKPVDLRLEQLWIRNVKITTGLVSTSTTPMLLKAVQSEKIKPQQLITHRFPLYQIMQAYEVFGNAAKEKAMKVILYND